MTKKQGWRVPFAIAALTGLLAFHYGASAQTPSMGIRPERSASTFEAARATFDSLPEADRKALQDNLIWTGHYSGMADGAFGRQTFEAIAALQLSEMKAVTGILTPQDRRNLQAAAQKAKDLAGFAIVTDSRSGVRIGVPTRLLPKQSVNPNGGSRWQSADGKITLDTRTAPADTSLQSLYERNLSLKAPGRMVTYKVLRPDFFVIAGETPTGKFYMRFSSGGPGIRGFSVGYDKALASQFDRMVVAIANSFTAFPDAPTAPIPVAQQPMRSPAPEQAAAQGPRLIGTGLIIGPHQVVTTAPLDACKDVRVQNLKPQRIEDRGIILLAFAEALEAQPIAFAEEEEEQPVFVVAFADDKGHPSLTVSSGQVTSGTTISAPLQPGASGAPVFDERGTLKGLVGPISSDARKIAGIIPAASHTMVPVAELAKLEPPSQGKKEPAAQSLRAADIVSSVRRNVVPILCGP